MQTSYKVIHWLARILSILAILFISMFALDAFSHGESIWQKLAAFLMHLTPTYILLAFLYIAWKRELAGGILFVLTGLATTPWVYSHNYAMNNSVTMTLGIILTINFPFIVIGTLYITSHLMKNNLTK